MSLPIAAAALIAVGIAREATAKPKKLARISLKERLQGNAPGGTQRVLETRPAGTCLPSDKKCRADRLAAARSRMCENYAKNPGLDLVMPPAVQVLACKGLMGILPAGQKGIDAIGSGISSAIDEIGSWF